MCTAVSCQAKGVKRPAFGTLKVESNSNVSVEHRLVAFSDFVITESNFSRLKKEQVVDLLNVGTAVDAARPGSYHAATPGRPGAPRRGAVTSWP